MKLRHRVKRLERAGFIACPRCLWTFRPGEHLAPTLALPPFEELRRFPYDELLRLHREMTRLGATAAARCPYCGACVPLPESGKDRAVRQAEYERLRALPQDELLRMYRQLLGPSEEVC